MADILERKHDVAVRQRGWPGSPVVVGKITTNRLVFSYAIHGIRIAAKKVANSKAADLPRALENLERAVQEAAEEIDGILNSFGDTDPRHDVGLVDRLLQEDWQRSASKAVTP